MPTSQELLRFSIPLLGIGLASPALGLIDTAVVGRHAGSLQLAALAPSVALVDIIAYLFRGLGVATTSYVATAIACNDVEQENRAVRNALIFATFFGVAAGLVILVGCEPMLLLLGGAGETSRLVLGDAAAYARVRAVGMPIGLAFMVLQASFLAARDWRPPTAAAVVACLANLIGDLILVAWLRLGVVGAAIATVLAQCSSLATLAVVRLRAAPRATTVAAAAAAAAAVTPATPKARGGGDEGDNDTGDDDGDGCGVSSEVSSSSPFWPTRAEIAEWTSFGLPIAIGQATRCATFSMVTAVATSAGAVGAAAHQVAMGLFYLTLPFGDALSNTAQVYFPQSAQTDEGRECLVRRVLRLGALTASATCLMVGAPIALPSLRRTFTVDTAVCAALGALLPFACACSFAFNLASAAEGCLIAARDLRLVALLYAASPLIVGAMLLLVPRALGWLGAGGVVGAPGGVMGGMAMGGLVAWTAFTTFHLTRLAVFTARAKHVAARPSTVQAQVQA